MTKSDPTLTPLLCGITIYPIKALDGLALERVEVNPGGALKGDRQFAMVDQNNAFINGKRYAQVNQIRARYSEDQSQVTLAIHGLDGEHTFDLCESNQVLLEWLSDALGMQVRLERDPVCGFPDSSGSPGPTLISRQTFAAVNEWFPEQALSSLRRRFRTNLEVDGVPAFWEDGLAINGSKTFRLGDVDFETTKLCDRCQVPTQDPETGEVDHAFQQNFMRQRAAMLPAGVNPYTLTVKTRLAQDNGGTLQLGARLELR